VLSGLLAPESSHVKARAMLRQAVIARTDYFGKNRKLSRPVYRTMITAVLKDVADNLKGTPIIVGQKPANVLQEDGSRLVLPNNLLNPEK